MSPDWHHARCGGRLNPEQHRRWVQTRVIGSTVLETVLSDRLEILYRCDRCNQVGVDAGPATREAPSMRGPHAR